MTNRFFACSSLEAFDQVSRLAVSQAASRTFSTFSQPRTKVTVEYTLVASSVFPVAGCLF